MKCNKCLKIIPKGEEIRFFSKKFGSSNQYGGCYCEDCWKKSGIYQYFEEGGKSPSNSSNSISPWAFGAMGMTVGAIIAGIVVWLFKSRDN